jgi:NADPH-dependent 2,4-dienoyl-CoA reductase/sulfur reductase-like enzyme
MRYLILGCGPAGISAAKSIRRAKPDAEIVIATEEYEAPYMRPLLPDLILGDADLAAIEDPQGKDLFDKRIQVLPSVQATGVDMGARRVGFSDGTEETYDSLLVATGGKPGVPASLKKELAAIVIFDSLRDAMRIRERVEQEGTIVVYGPGYLAIEACRALRRAKREVVWIKPDLPKYGYPIKGELEARVLDDVRSGGASIREGDDIVHVWEDGGKPCVAFTRNGDEIPCTTLVVATERVPSVRFLAGSGVMMGTGILVDDSLQTSVPGIYAAGDCAEFMVDRTKGVTRINFGWRSAIRQGSLAGENMGGGKKRLMRNPEDYFWALFGFPLQDRSRKE